MLLVEYKSMNASHIDNRANSFVAECWCHISTLKDFIN